MVYQCIYIRQVPREVLKTAASGLGFQHLLRDLAYVNAWKNMFDPYIKASPSPHNGFTVEPSKAIFLLQFLFVTSSSFRYCLVFEEVLFSVFISCDKFLIRCLEQNVFFACGEFMSSLFSRTPCIFVTGLHYTFYKRAFSLSINKPVADSSIAAWVEASVDWVGACIGWVVACVDWVEACFETVPTVSVFGDGCGDDRVWQVPCVVAVLGDRVGVDGHEVLGFATPKI